MSEITVDLSERELSALRWTVPILRGVEKQWDELAGTKEGEATSDVIAAIVARADFAAKDEKLGGRERE